MFMLIRKSNAEYLEDEVVHEKHGVVEEGRSVVVDVGDDVDESLGKASLHHWNEWRIEGREG